MISKKEAFDLIKGSTKRDHAILVSKIMRRLAKELHEDSILWELVGLLHDLDYDIVNGDMTRHGITATGILEGRLPEGCLYAIKAHDQRTGFVPRNLLDRSLVAADAVAILIEDQEARNIEDDEVLKARLEAESIDKPWIGKTILAFCGETGLRLERFLILGGRSEIDIPSSRDFGH